MGHIAKAELNKYGKHFSIENLYKLSKILDVHLNFSKIFNLIQIHLFFLKMKNWKPTIQSKIAIKI